MSGGRQPVQADRECHQEYVVARSKPQRFTLARNNTYAWNGVGECTILLSMQNKIGHHRHSLRCVRSPIVKRLRRAFCFLFFFKAT